MRTRTWLILVFIICIVGVALYVRSNTNTEPVFESATVLRGTVAQTVGVTGHVEPLSRLDLAFPIGGRLNSLSVTEGVVVDAGTVLATLEQQTRSAAYGEAAARLDREQAVYDQLKAPLREEEKAVKDAVVREAQTAYERSIEGAQAAIARAFTYADDAVREEGDELFEGGRASPRFGVNFTYGTTKYVMRADNTLSQELSLLRKEIEDVLRELEARAYTPEVLILPGALQTTDTDLVRIELFLTKLAFAVNQYVPEDTTAQTVYESYQTSVATARTALSAARSDIATAQTSYETAKAALRSAQRTQDLADAGTTDEVLDVQRAAVRVAEQVVNTTQVQLRDTRLVTPIAGVISRVTPDVGEVVGPYETVVEVLTPGQYEVEAYVPEADIAKVELGDTAHITFDAFDRTDLFEGEVVRIALSETMREGVPTYKTTVVLTKTPDDERILRPGMTADIDINTARKDDVLYVPMRSVLRDGARTYVRQYDDEFVERDVELGLRGSDGTIEIREGLSEGEEIVLFIDES